MRLRLVLILLLATYFVSSAEAHAISAGKGFLRGDATSSDPVNPYNSIPKFDEERDVGATQVFGMVVKAMRAKAKLTIMMGRGFSPAKAMKKLNVQNRKDKRFNSFARYYAKYLLKYPKKAANSPVTAEDAAMLVKMQQWLKERVFPQQIAQKIQKFGQNDIQKYTKLYWTMWTENQAKLSAKVKIKHLK